MGLPINLFINISWEPITQLMLRPPLATQVIPFIITNWVKLHPPDSDLLLLLNHIKKNV